MIKKLTLMGILFFIASTFLFCIDEEQKNPQPDLSDARARIRPKADAGKDVTITLPTNASKLDGSNSKDSLGVIKNYQWSNISGPSTFVISNPTKALTDVTSLVDGVYTFRLTVTNDKNAKSYDDVVVTVNKSTAITTTTLTDALYFSGNMDNVTITSSYNKRVFNGWDQLQNHQYIKYMSLNDVDEMQYAFQDIRKDPVNSTKNALYATTIDDNSNENGTNRAQITLRFKDGVKLPVYHTSHRIFLNPDIGYLKNYSSNIGWFTLFETWNRHVDEWDGDIAGSARWNLALNKASGIGQPLYWRMEAEYMQPANLEHDNMWDYTNKVTPIPFGQWFTLDIYMKIGDSTNGRMIVKITPDGGQTTTLFDIKNSTMYPGHPEIELRAWQPFKLYTSDIILDWMRANNKKFSAYYNDFKWYQN